MFRIKFHIILVLYFVVITGTTSCKNQEKITNKSPETTRVKYNFNPDWKFIKDNPENAQNVNFDDMMLLFNKYEILGIYMRASGKIGGFVRDRTKLFLVRFGFCSKSIKLYKYNFFCQSVRTKAGSMGFKILLVFK